jgi:two-component system response regulator HydG
MRIDDHWKKVIDTLRDGLLIVDPGGTIIAINASAERITGYQSDDLIGRSCRILNCTGCEVYGSGKAWCSLFDRGDVREKKCLISKKNHRNIHIIKSATVLRDENGCVIGAVETLTDISHEVHQETEILSLRKSCRLNEGFHGILGTSAPMQRLFELIDNVARSKTPAMILGPSGTGKELVARAIHESSPRKNKPYIQVNCSALNDNLLESELFGHVKGAFTGADQLRIGRFEAAQEGTIFLDEIGDLSFSTQTKLLRVLEENKVERVGDHRPIAVDVRIITATNKDLELLVADGSFREDLFFRINVFPIHCPSIAKRTEDIPLIVREFIDRENLEFNKHISGITPAAMEKLMVYPWPGNVREIRNAIQYAFVLCRNDVIDCAHLPPKIANPAIEPPTNTRKMPAKDRIFQDTLTALHTANGNQSCAAKMLGVSRVTIWKRIKKYGIDVKRI